MAFTYTAGSTTTLNRVRFELGDTDSNAALFADEEIEAKLAERGDDVLLAAADLCEILARKYARAYDFETDGQKFSRSQMSKQYLELARQLRARAGGVTSVATTRVDGYSSDIPSDQVSNAGTATQDPRHRFYAPRADRIPT